MKQASRALHVLAFAVVAATLIGVVANLLNFSDTAVYMSAGGLIALAAISIDRRHLALARRASR